MTKFEISKPIVGFRQNNLRVSDLASKYTALSFYIFLNKIALLKIGLNSFTNFENLNPIVGAVRVISQSGEYCLQKNSSTPLYSGTWRSYDFLNLRYKPDLFFFLIFEPTAV